MNILASIIRSIWAFFVMKSVRDCDRRRTIERHQREQARMSARIKAIDDEYAELDALEREYLREYQRLKALPDTPEVKEQKFKLFMERHDRLQRQMKQNSAWRKE